MTQMTQRREFPWAPDLRFLGHLGHTKNNDPNDPMAMATGASLQFKTMTQMTQMTQWPPAGPPPAPACNMRHGGRRPVRRRPCWQIPTMPEGGWVGPTAKGQQKRTGYEQFFFSYKFFFLVE